MAMYYETVYDNLTSLFDTLPSSLPTSPPSSKLPPQLNAKDLQEEGVWYAFNKVMHASFGDKARGLKLEERGAGLTKTLSLIKWCLKELKKLDDSSDPVQYLQSIFDYRGLGSK
ncbi:hypothetical protein Clacol_007024 [Clathrus columnatus]|uniref:Uncharacterized protein n=1 Tax=Clathrus columnatus TaxID=1419009 RepID=A0AAV5ADS7_9AGAM|nr:hypothetical protein Clacol_007024 [Clathrus columnatus]